MNILVIQNHPVEGLGLYARHFLDKHMNLTVVHPYSGESLPMVDSVDAIFVGGTPICAYDIEKPGFLRKEIMFLGQAIQKGKPCFGVCFGAQILAQILGAQVKKAEEMEIGCYEVTRTAAGETDPLLAGFPQQFPVFQWHGDTFDVPMCADLLIEGSPCTNQMFRCENIIGAQFHLELTSEDAASWADEYPEELERFGKTKDEVATECMKREREMGTLARMLMDRFVDLIAS